MANGLPGDKGNTLRIRPARVRPFVEPSARLTRLSRRGEVAADGDGLTTLFDTSILSLVHLPLPSSSLASADCFIGSRFHERSANSVRSRRPRRGAAPPAGRRGAV